MLGSVAALLIILSVGMPVAAEELTDQQITNAVDGELINDPATPAYLIDVTTTDGFVTLSGKVDNILAKDRAEKIAATVKGVRGIINRIEVSAPFRSDTEIKEDVVDAFLWDPAMKTREIDVSVKDGIVTLKGTAHSWQERELAERVAKGVKGVNDINDDIIVEYKAGRSDAEIKSDIESALHWDAYVDNAMINVSVDDAKVMLSGTVGSLSEKLEAGADAWVDGVSDVRNDLDVKWWARDDRLRKDKYAAKTNEEIKNAVEEAFLYDPRVVSFEVDAEPNGGYVTLRGVVDNLKAKRAAAQDARNVVGVWGVKNLIKVRANEPSDRTIEANVENALMRDPYVDRYEITVSVVNGEVYLDGDVDSAFEKARADDIASRQAGVVRVKNFLTVNEWENLGYNPYTDDWDVYDYDWYTSHNLPASKPDWEIKEDIKTEYFWSPFVDSDAVHVEVDNGVAHLTGTVDSWGEREAATEKAYEGGATLVDNDLRVEYGPEYYSP